MFTKTSQPWPAQTHIASSHIPSGALQSLSCRPALSCFLLGRHAGPEGAAVAFGPAHFSLHLAIRILVALAPTHRWQQGPKCAAGSYPAPGPAVPSATGADAPSAPGVYSWRRRYHFSDSLAPASAHMEWPRPSLTFPRHRPHALVGDPAPFLSSAQRNSVLFLIRIPVV